MDMNEFIKQMNELRRAYDFCISDNCDLWSQMTGFLFFRSEESKKPFANITGVRYKADGSGFEGDFEGVLSLMKEVVQKEYS